MARPAAPPERTRPPHTPVISIVLSTAALVSTRAEYDHLFRIYVPIAIAVLCVVLLAVGFALVRFRGTRTPTRRTGADRLEGAYAILLACIAAFLLYETFTAEHQVDTVADRERPALVVDVTAARWEWEFHYPAVDITHESGTVGNAPLVVPADEAIRFDLTSQDVIHSMWIPQLEFKRDLIRGIVEHVTLTFTHTGVFDGQCATFCGEDHAEMTFTVHVLSPRGFDAWLAANRDTGVTT